MSWIESWSARLDLNCSIWVSQTVRGVVLSAIQVFEQPSIPLLTLLQIANCVSHGFVSLLCFKRNFERGVLK